jgi:hypothetical protein
VSGSEGVNLFDRWGGSAARVKRSSKTGGDHLRSKSPRLQGKEAQHFISFVLMLGG